MSTNKIPKIKIPKIKKIANITENKIIGFYNDSDDLTDPDNATYVKIELLGRGKILDSNYFLISMQSFEKIIRHQWYIDSNGYPMTYTARSKTLHKNLLGKQEKGFVIDHINRNKLDNRLENLRWADDKTQYKNRNYIAPIGESVGNSFWTEDQVKEIKELHKKGLGKRRIAKLLNCSITQAQSALDNWKHLDCI